MRRRSFAQSFLDAWSGITYSLRTQRNMRIHLAAAAAAVLLSLLLRLGRLELALVILAIYLVIAAEMFNTAVEKTVDLFVTTYHPLAKLAKDIAAGAVLVAALNAVATGLLVILPHLLRLWR
jgi:diacylglycerol kinase